MRPQTFRTLATLVAWLCAVVVSVPAWAANKAIAVYVEGNESSAARERILEATPKSVDVVDPAKFESALGKAGHKGQMGATVWVKNLREKQLKSVRKALGDLKA